MGDGLRLACNRRVHAEVRVTDAVADREHIEIGFRREEWSYEPLATDKYLISVPVYSARFAAVDVARAKLLDFGEQVANLEIVYLRAQPPQPQRGFLYRSHPVRLRGSSRVRGRTRAPHRIFGVGPRRAAIPMWEVRSPQVLDNRHLDHLEERFTANYVGGEMELREMSSPSTSSKLDRAARWWNEIISTDSVLVFLVAIEILMASIVASESVGPIVSLLAFAIGFAVSAGIALPLSMEVAGWAAKVVAIGLPIFIFFGLLGWFIADEELGQSEPIASAAGVAALVVIARGLLHLLRLRPRVRVVVSLSVLTALVAVSFGGARFAVSLLAGASGVDVVSVAVPTWVWPLAGALLLWYLLLGAAIAGSVWGWFEYAGATSAFRNTPDLLTGAVLLMFATSLTVSFLAATAKLNAYFDDWLEEFANLRTPQLTSGFMYRACLLGADRADVENNNAAIIGADELPVVVIEGSDGPEWTWDPTEMPETSLIDATRIDATKYQIVRVEDGVEECAGAPF